MPKSISTGGPMLASNEIVTDFDRVSYPVIASPKLDGRLITFKHFAQSGVRNKPRHGQFVAFRAEEDL